MKTHRRVRRLAASIPVLTLGLALGFAGLSASAQTTSPVGSYGILLNQWKGADASSSPGALLGVLNFDGAGNVSGSYTVVGKNPTATGMWTGTSSGNPDGSATLNLTLDVGATVTAAMAVTDGGTGLQFIVTGGTLAKPGQVVTGTGRIQSAGTPPAGSYAYLLNQWPDANNSPGGIFGIFNLDGAGNLTGSYTIVGNTGALPSLSGAVKGTYSINPDGTGSVTVNLDIGITATEAIILIDGGAGIQMLQTSNNGGGSGVVSGSARKQ
jgi:hypothetical protein